MNKKQEHFTDVIVNKGEKPARAICIGVPMTGILRAEWVFARYGQTTPCNWSQMAHNVWLDQVSPINHTVSNARNMIWTAATEKGFEWLFFIDHDVILPQGTLLKLGKYMRDMSHPIVNGLYFTRSTPSEPLMYRGMGDGFYGGWKMGDKVYVGGCGLGCTIIHKSILRAVYDEAEPYNVSGHKIRRVFAEPALDYYDPETKTNNSITGTEDLVFYKRLVERKIYKKAGWKKFQKKKYPLLVDTSIFCRHIDFSGIQYPAFGEEREFMR